MARPGVSFYEVMKVADTLTNKGASVTIDSVRGILGTGSKTTIAHHLKQWRADTKHDAQYDGIPKDLIDAVKLLYERTKNQAQQNYEALQKKHQDKMEELTQKAIQSATQATKLQQEIETLKTIITEKGQTIVRHQKEIKILNAQQEQIDSEYTRDKALLKEKIEQITTLKSHLKASENNAAHYLEAMREQRDEERNYFSSQLNVLNAENLALKKQLTSEEEKICTIKEEQQAVAQQAAQSQKLYETKVTEYNKVSEHNLSLSAEVACLNEKLKLAKLKMGDFALKQPHTDSQEALDRANVSDSFP